MTTCPKIRGKFKDAPLRWWRYCHPVIPVSFDVPAGMRRVGEWYWVNGTLRKKTGEEEIFHNYGWRLVDIFLPLSAIELTFAWADDRHEIALPMTIEGLSRNIHDANYVLDFYFALFYQSKIDEEMRGRYRDVGAVLIDGHFGRHIQLLWPATSLRPEKTPTDFYLIPVDAHNVLAIKVNFYKETEEERAVIASYIVESVRIHFPERVCESR